MAHARPTIIGADWGSTHVRAFRFGAGGGVLDTRRSQAGMSTLQPSGFEPALRALVGDWIGADGGRVIISGMAGARGGWLEAPYVPCPAGAEEIAAGLVRAPASGLDVWVAPGIVFTGEDGARDVMRGEETQTIGALGDDFSGVAIAPGTHSKWAEVRAGRIVSVRTFMTGEVFSLLRTHSILGKLMQADAHDPAAFAEGLARSRRGEALLNTIFGVRVAGLFDEWPRSSLSSLLSGMLIGSEIADGGARIDLCTAPLRVIGAGALASAYVGALAQFGAANVLSIDGEAAAARGLWRLARLWAP